MPKDSFESKMQNAAGYTNGGELQKAAFDEVQGGPKLPLM